MERNGSPSVWDVAVVGAGPAGALAAYELARRGCSVLLLDKAVFPRAKVCGCCLNGQALAALDGAGLGDLVHACKAVPLHAVRLSAHGRHATLWLPRAMALSRATLDHELVRAAVRAGACFRPGTMVRLGGSSETYREIELQGDGRSDTVRARVLLAADGLGGRLMPSTKSTPSPTSRLGAGAIVEAAPCSYQPGTIFMACGVAGYVGLVRLEDGRLDVAAAFDPEFAKVVGGLGQAAVTVLREAGLPPVAELAGAEWRGTPLLSRRAERLAAERVFVVGDSAGYVEPFTGEGIAWALNGARAVTPLVQRAVDGWSPSLAAEWTRCFRQTIAKRQRTCSIVAQFLRHPVLVRGSIALLAVAPWLARPILSRLDPRRAHRPKSIYSPWQFAPEHASLGLPS